MEKDKVYQHLFVSCRHYPKDYIDDHKDTFDEENLRDFIDAFLKEMKTEIEYFSNDQLSFFVQDLFAAGMETTSTRIRRAILCLIHYPQTQNKIHKEIKEVMGERNYT
ncbi:unnamed protein product [Clavelina lepadiformis]|uniref:Cytochrome P450 n=1 Tax=Clavelina lepadiformis TaxID=159417 RepID=A0ABP0FBY7_CLALP